MLALVAARLGACSPEDEARVRAVRDEAALRALVVALGHAREPAGVRAALASV